MAQHNAIETGIDTPKTSDVRPVTVDADVISFADDGEFATTWAIERVDGSTVRVELSRHEAGSSEPETVETFEGEGVTRWGFDISHNVERIGRDLAEADPEAAIEAAREHWRSE